MAKKKEKIKQILFDEAARREFLTGFHKRKLAKTEAAKKKSLEREKKARLEARREQRRLLRERAIENAAQVENACGGSNTLVDWTVADNAKGKQKETQEFQDEEHLATVTVVEDFDTSVPYSRPTGSSASSSPLKGAPTRPSGGRERRAKKRRPFSTSRNPRK